MEDHSEHFVKSKQLMSEQQSDAETLFTIYQSENAVELRSGLEEEPSSRIYCASFLYESAIKIAQIVASQHNLPFKNYVRSC